MHQLRKSLYDLYRTALSLSRFCFSAVCSLFLSVDRGCRERCVASLSSSPTSGDVEVCSTSIADTNIVEGILLFPSSPSLVFVLKNISTEFV